MRSAVLRRFSSAVELCYEAALKPELWQGAVGAIADAQESPCANLLTPSTAPGAGGFIFSHGFSAGDIQLWGTKYVSEDPWARGVVGRKLSEGQVFLGSELVSYEELGASRFYKEFLHRQQAWHMCTGLVFTGAEAAMPMTALTVFRGRRAPKYDERSLETHALLTNHVSRALGTMLKLRNAELRLSSTLAALDHMPTPVVLFNSRGRVTFANNAASSILASKDGLVLKRQVSLDGEIGSLSAEHSGDDASLRRQLEACLRRTPDEISHFSAGVKVRRHSGAPAYVIQLSALPFPNEFSTSAQGSCAIAFITDRTRALSLNEAILRQTYDLTKAECTLAREILAGRSLRQCAESLRVSENTVKTQLRSIYSKTGSGGRVDLVKLLHSLSAIP